MKRPVLTTSAFLALLLLVVWSAVQRQQAFRQAEDAWRRLQNCRQMARRIRELRKTPVQFAETQRSGDALLQRVEDAAREARIDAERIAAIAPAEPRRIGDTPYKEQETRVELFHVTLSRLVRFLLAVPTADPAIHINTLLLRTPVQTGSPGGPKAELWNAEVILTSRFYAPMVPRPQ